MKKVFLILTLSLIAFSTQVLAGNRGFDIKQEWNSCRSGGCDLPYAIKKRFDRGVRSTGKSMTKGVRSEFEPMMDYLFDENIQPLLGDLDQVIRSNINNSDGVITRTLDKIDSIIAQTITRFESATTDTITQIKRDIILEASSKLDEQRKLLISDVNKIIEVIDCSVEGQRVAIENFIENKISGIWPNFSCILGRRTSCQANLNLDCDKEKYTNSELYKYAKCEYLTRITGDTPVKDLLWLYGDLQGLAARFQCLERRAPAAAENYTLEWLEYGKRYTRWKSTQ